MSNYVKVSVPKMKSDSEELHAKIEKIPQFVHELDASMKALGDCWTGYSWEAFQMQMETDIVNMLDLYDWLRNLQQKCSDAEKKYGESEENSYNCVDRVRI